ncbi:heterogeneous nuclear ribonucleoprotein 1 [Elaeis guineensis]|uniref:Heterogeneous nuclear ribonucleoprotein 1 n=1 Tax=Elaeis guineensis var. tenera TaxID=51953 RepID=A0A6I9RZ10_ELAGV|nr:heterogeneous nuclear ribonucleoprotein 1 [Elaeis guineensis]
MDSDQGKLFIGGISWETTEEKMKEYFSKYGEVLQTVIMRDKTTGRPRGFGFVVFADPSILDRVLQDSHTIDGRTVEAKRALSREEQQASKSGNPAVGRTGGGHVSGGNFRTKKIFVGGLPPTLTEEAFRQYFQGYGDVTDVVVMYDQNTQRPRGFGFISFSSEDAVDRVLHKTFHELNGKLVEVKRALPKDANPSSGGGRPVAGGPYQSNSASGVNMSSYDGRADTGRYMQPPAAGGGYPAYGSTGYGTPGYGYGAANNGVGYGGYGVGGYGSAAAGYGGPTGAYGNPNAPAAGYPSGPPGAPRSPWSNQAPSAYGSASYGANTGYGAPGSWNAAGSGGAAAPTGQSPSGTTGYGNQGYGYGGYSGAEVSYGSQGGYGAVGARGSGGPPTNPAGGPGDQGAGSGYMGGSYGDASGGSGYPNSWRTDPSQGMGYGTGQVNGPAGYGGAYGGAQSRQAQQQ